MINEKLKEYRKANRLTQQQIATALNIERSTYAYYENGRHNPSINILSKLARLYNISLDSLIGNNSDFPSLSVADTTNLYNKDEDIPDSDSGSVVQYLSKLAEDEKLLLLLYRVIKNKDLAIVALKELTEQELE